MIMRRDKAVTLTEMLVVLVIIGVLLTVSIPLFSRYGETTKLKTAARSVVTALRTARTYAISRNTTYQVRFEVMADDGRHAFFISTDGDDPIAGEKRYMLFSGLEFGTDTQDTAVAFFPAGSADADAQIEIEDVSSENAIIVSVEETTGRVRMEAIVDE